MKKQYLLLLVAGLLAFFTSCKQQASYDALIITGQNNHNWQASYPILKKILDQTGLFSTDTIITPAAGEDMSTFNPDFTKYDLVVLDYNGDPWNEATNEGFLEFVRNGGGVVVYHAADNAFADWEEYNKIIGLGGWGGRDINSGPYVYYNRGELVRDDTTEGIGGTHGPRSEFRVTNINMEHPITKGLPRNWMHGNDELYSRLRGPAENMEILATAFSTAGVSRGAGGYGAPAGPTPGQGAGPGGGTPPAGFGQRARPQAAAPVSQAAALARVMEMADMNSDMLAEIMETRELDTAGVIEMMNQYLSMQRSRGGRQNGRDEPVLMTITYGKGRIFHTVLGHADPDGGPAMQCVGFIVTTQRGAEWAVSGEVTQEVPFDFPCAAGVVLRPDFEEVTLDDALASITNYEVDKSTKGITYIRNYIRRVSDDQKALLSLEKDMVGVLENSSATAEGKKLILRELSWMGSDYSIPVIEGLQSDAAVQDEAAYALERLQSAN